MKGALMGHVKRFGDFCAAFAAFAAAMFMFRQFMGFDFGEVEGIIEKLKYFFLVWLYEPRAKLLEVVRREGF